MRRHRGDVGLLDRRVERRRRPDRARYLEAINGLPGSLVVGLVAFARVYLGAHNPLDVLGGIGLGLAIGGGANLAIGVAKSPYPPSSTGAPTSEPYSVHEPS